MNKVVRYPPSSGIKAEFSTTQELLNLDFIRLWEDAEPFKSFFKRFSYTPYFKDSESDLPFLLCAEYEKAPPQIGSLVVIAYLYLDEDFKLDIPFVEK